MSTAAKYTLALVAVLLLAAYLILGQLTKLSLAEADRLRVAGPVSTPIQFDSAAAHLTSANHLYYDKLPKADSAARLQRFDSTLATW